MGEIIEFPQRPAREWTSLQLAMLEVLHRTNAPEEMIEDISERMEVFYHQCLEKEFELNLEFPIKLLAGQEEIIRTAVQQFSSDLVLKIHDFTTSIFFERLKREIEVWQTQHGR